MLRPKGESSLPPIVVASVAAVTQRTLERSAFESSRHRVAVGQRVDLNSAAESLADDGLPLGARRLRSPALQAGGAGSSMSSRPGRSFPHESSSGVTPSRASVCSIRPPNAQWSRCRRRLSCPARRRCLTSSRVGKVKELYDRLDMSNCATPTRDRIQEEMTLLLSGHALEEPGFYQGFFCRGSVLDFLDPEALIVVERPGTCGGRGPETGGKVHRDEENQGG